MKIHSLWFPTSQTIHAAKVVDGKSLGALCDPYATPYTVSAIEAYIEAVSCEECKRIYHEHPNL